MEAASQFFVVIPTGGSGRSLFPITSFLPKCLVPVGPKPLLRHIIDSFIVQPSNIKQIIILTSDFHGLIQDAVKDHYDPNFVCVENTNDRVPASLITLKNRLTDFHFILHYCDVLLRLSSWNSVIRCFLEQYEADTSDYLGLLLCSQQYQMGVGFVTEGESHYLGKLYEKPQHLYELFGGSLHINTGVGIFSKSFLDTLVAVDKQLKRSDIAHDGIFETTLPELLKQTRSPENRFGLYRISKWHHVQELKDLEAIQRDYK